MLLWAEHFGSRFDIPGKHSGTGPLDVIVEAQALVAHPVQNGKGLCGVEVLELDQGVREGLGHGVAELLHNVQVLLTSKSLLLVALQVKSIIHWPVIKRRDWNLSLQNHLGSVGCSAALKQGV